MTPNSKHLLYGLPILGMVVWCYSDSFRRGDWQVFAVAGLAIAGMVVFSTVRFGSRRVRRLLQSESPAQLVDMYTRALGRSRTPDMDAVLAELIARIYALYGDFDAARASLSTVSWVNRPPPIQAMRPAGEAFICYLEGSDPSRGLQLAKDAQDLAATSRGFSSGGRSARFFGLCVDIGAALCSTPSGAIIERLERMASRHVLLQLPALWGLSVAYRRLGRSNEGEAAGKAMRAIAPHCRGLYREQLSFGTK